MLDNHDMDRFLRIAAGDVDRLLLAVVLLVTLPGVPMLYYGTEVGLRGSGMGADGRWREPMRWGRTEEALTHAIRDRLRLRAELSALRGGACRLLVADDAQGCVAFARQDAAMTVTVAANLSRRHQTLRLPMERDARLVIGVETSHSRGDVVTVDLPPLTASVFAAATP